MTEPHDRSSDARHASNAWRASADDLDPQAIAARIERLLVILERERGEVCGACGERTCGHDVLLSVSAGFEDDPLCASCIALELGRATVETTRSLSSFAQTKECLRTVWARETELEERAAVAACPARLSVSGESATVVGTERIVVTAPEAAPPVPESTARWDAGGLGCGELVLELRLRLRQLDPGSVIHLTATDAGAPEDLPAWCRITGNPLVSAAHPEYFIRRKD